MSATAERPPRPRRSLSASIPHVNARLVRAPLRHAGFVVAVALAAVMDTNTLAKNGYSNIYYAAAVKSMLHSLHDFVFVSFDPGGLISVDKPPLALWVQALSAKLFGFSPLSLLLPEALAGVLAVAVLYVVLARRLGAAAAFAGALALAVFPSFVAISRDNGVDPLLLLLMVLACAAALRACETASWRWLLASALLVGLAFNAKALAAYLVVPGIALGYVVCAPGSLARRATQLLAAGVVLLAVSFAWIAAVELTPRAQRPFVGGSTHDTELGLAFEYNGFGRVGGQEGGPGRVFVRPGAYVPAREILRPALPPVSPPSLTGASRGTRGAATLARAAARARERNVIPFGGPPGPLRLFHKGLGDQGAWIVPFALVGLLALIALTLLDRRAPPGEPDGGRWGWRRDARLASALVLGGWFLVEAVVLSASKGIVHPYYASALAPGAAAMLGAGAAALVALVRGRLTLRLLGIGLVACALAGTVAAQIVLIERERYWEWFVPVLLGGCALALLGVIAARRLAPLALALALGVLLATPTAYATSTWLAPVEGTFPVAGPQHNAGVGGYGISSRALAIDVALIAYVRTHHPGSRWALLTVASNTAAPMILKGLDAGALAGYSGTDAALDGAGLARLVARGEARYVMLGGDYSLRGGNGATKAVLRACTQLRSNVWHSPKPFPNGLVLFDCAGRVAALASP